PESVLLLTGSARLGTSTRAAITAAVLSDGRAVVREPLVRTVNSYAFAVLRLAAQRNGDPPPRLITSAEQDGIIRELLAGDLEDGDASPVAWPAQLRPALSTVGFANELRDLLARCTASGALAADPNGWPQASSRRPTSRSCCCAPQWAWRRHRQQCPRSAPPNSLVPRSKPSPPTRTCCQWSATGSSYF